MTRGLLTVVELDKFFNVFISPSIIARVLVLRDDGAALAVFSYVLAWSHSFA